MIGFGPLRSEANFEEADAILRDLLIIGMLKRICNDKYTVPKTNDNYDSVLKSLPNLFEDSTVFCGGIEGKNFGTCKVIYITISKFLSVYPGMGIHPVPSHLYLYLY